jgi:hypothetical protein
LLHLNRSGLFDTDPAAANEEDDYGKPDREDDDSAGVDDASLVRMAGS